MPRGEVLVAVVNDTADFEIAREKHWYRIPLSSQKKWLKDCWPPRWLAFYQTKVFGSEAYAVNYMASVLSIRVVPRLYLFPDMDRNDPKANSQYFQLMLGPLQNLSHPILSRRSRRIVFIPTTWDKFSPAVEINDLWDESPLEDKLWAIFKQTAIPAERQYPIAVKKRNYFLDFAVFCNDGKIDVETDGDTWHSDPERIPLDNLRDNDLTTGGWRVLRFNSVEVRERPVEYCVAQVMENINRLGDLDEASRVPRRFNPDDPLGPQQLGIFS